MQKLERKIKKDSCYTLSFDTRYEKEFESAIPDTTGKAPYLRAHFDTPISLQISLSNSECVSEEVIHLSFPVTHQEWKRNNIQFKPTKDYYYIILEATYYKKIGYGHLLLDNFSDIFSVNCTK